MAGIFKTIGSTLQAVDTIAASGSRRLSVWAREQESKTKYRHVSTMMRIKREAAEELEVEITATEAALQNPNTVKAMEMLNKLDAAEIEADSK